MSFELPSNDPIVDDKRMAFRTWMQWLSSAHNIILSVQQSGPTAERPVSMLWIGRQFYDTTLNKPVYVQAVKPTVWRDAAGTIV
jgi:hypothetical protein